MRSALIAVDYAHLLHWSTGPWSKNKRMLHNPVPPSQDKQKMANAVVQETREHMNISL